MHRLKFLLAGLLISTPALAQEVEGEAPAEGEVAPDPGAGTETAAATEAAAAPAGNSVVPVGAGKIMIAGSTVNINMSADAVAKPISFAPAVYYGVNEKLAVGLTHDGGSLPITPRPGLRTIAISIPNPIDPTMPFTGIAAAGAGICISGEDSGCNKIYDNVGADVVFGLSEGKNSLAVHGGLDVFTFDPMVLTLRAGVLGSFAASDKLRIVYDPRLSIGLTERDFNKEQLDVPVWAWFAVNDKLSAYAHTGIRGPLDGFGDAFSIPLGLGANFQVNEKLTAGADFHFLNLLGKGSSADGRALGLRAIYML
jgi:hypothetical protein